MVRLDLSIDSMYLRSSVKVAMAMPYPGFSKCRHRTLWCLHPALKNGDFFFEDLGLGELADKYNLTLVAPSLGNSYFIDSEISSSGSFLMDELCPFLIQRFSLPPDQKDNLLLGISMGAYGGAKWALTEPQKFSTVFLISGVYDEHADLEMFKDLRRDEKNLMKMVTQDHKKIFNHPSKNSVCLAEQLERTADCSTAFNIFCGSEDHISLTQSQEFHLKLKKQGFDSQFRKHPGGVHDRRTWSGIIDEIENDFFEKQADQKLDSADKSANQ